MYWVITAKFGKPARYVEGLPGAGNSITEHMARGSSLLLLDEPTSALDAATEARVLYRMGQAFPQACIVASVHRLSLLERFDSVLLMEAGRIVDHGPSAEVLARQPALRGAFARST